MPGDERHRKRFDSPIVFRAKDLWKAYVGSMQFRNRHTPRDTKNVEELVQNPGIWVNQEPNIGSSTGPDRLAHRVFWNVFENIRAKAIASYMDEGTEAGTQSSFPFDTNAAYVLSRAPYMMNEISASTSVKSP